MATLRIHTTSNNMLELHPVSLTEKAWNDLILKLKAKTAGTFDLPGRRILVNFAQVTMIEFLGDFSD